MERDEAGEAALEMLREDDRRIAEMFAPFDPVTGKGSIGERELLEVPDFPLPRQWVPREMTATPLIQELVKAGSLAGLCKALGAVGKEAEARVTEQVIRIRARCDFPFWAATLCYIKRKGGGDEVLFRLQYPQRKFVRALEERRLAGKPIRIVLLKARQWGGSTTSQLYMAWLQLMRKRGLNSLIIAHQGSGSDEIKQMFDRMISRYPVSMLHEAGEAYNPDEPKMTGVGKSGSISRIPQRGCTIKIGTAQKPDGCRGGDYNLVHLSEVGLWTATEGKKPEDIVQAACSGVLYEPYTMVVYESTAKGVGNFFHREYKAAADPDGGSQFDPLFIPWYEIEQYSLPFKDEAERLAFARELWLNRGGADAGSERREPGRYLWWLWKKGARLSGIKWYIKQRAAYTDHAQMASESPTDDIEAFANTGRIIFDKYLVDKLSAGCRPPMKRGGLTAAASEGKGALKGLTFTEDSQGRLKVWSMPEADGGGEAMKGRYLTAVDIGGRGDKADWSVVAVYDRVAMADGGRPSVCAQWRGHIDIDLLAWKAAQIAAWYNNSLLVIESNTLETHDRERAVEGDQSHYILNQIADVYPNLYARRQSEEDIRQGLPRKYGFHANTATKPMIIANLVKMVREGLWVEREAEMLRELMQYERKPNGAYGAVPGAHDDILMTRAIGLHVCWNEMEMPRWVERKAVAQPRRRGVSEATF